MLKREGEVRIPSGCAISGIMNVKRKLFSGSDIIKSIKLMHERSNGLGGGFAIYGIYPELKDYYAFHIFFDTKIAKDETEDYLKSNFTVVHNESIPTKNMIQFKDKPIIWRYFVKPKIDNLVSQSLNEDEYVVKSVFNINAKIKGAYVFSSGKNMGIFKAVGYPEDVGEFYKVDEYKGYLFTAHGRFPTNTPGWWGGAHPFGLLNLSVVHNGELSSYGTNLRYLEEFGYVCSLQTDTEVVAYIFDLLTRVHKLPPEIACHVMAPPFYDDIDLMDEDDKKLYKSLRIVYGRCLMNGPFSILIGWDKGLIALNDRIKLRSLVAATKGDMVYVASEESAIRAVCSTPDKTWAPKGGEPLIFNFEEA